MAGDQACQNVHKARYALTVTTTIPPFRPPARIDPDPLTRNARDGARQMLAAAIKAAAANVVAFFGDALLVLSRFRAAPGARLKRFAFDLVHWIKRKTHHTEWRECLGLPST